MKKCPFCKNIIDEKIDKCPYCNRILIERIDIIKKDIDNEYINNNQKDDTFTNKEYKIKFNILNYFISNLNILFNYLIKLIKKLIFQISNNSNIKKIIIFLILWILFIIVTMNWNNQKTIINTSNTTPISIIPNNNNDNNKSEIENIQQENNEKVNTENILQEDNIAVDNYLPLWDSNIIKNYNSLANWEILFQNNTYRNGLGELEIENNSNLDTVAKLVNISTNKSIFTVYIKANNSYTITKVDDGDYKLFFNWWNDWNNKIKAFTINSNFEVFENSFNFITTKYEDFDYIRTKYSTFKVTLSPTTDWKAKTDNVDNLEFANY